MSESNVFADVPSEDSALDIDKSFERLEKDKADTTASESQPEKKETVQKPAPKGEPAKDNTSDEKKLPFHQHPRWIKTQETLKEFEKRVTEYETKIKALESKGTADVSLPDWWKKRYGETPESKKSYQDYVTATQAERNRIKEEVTQDILKANSEAQTKEKQGQEYVDTQLAEMTDEGLKFEKNELLKFMVDFQKDYGAGSLVDAQGNYDFRKSLVLMEKMNPKPQDTSIETKKRIGADLMRTKAKTASTSEVPVISRKALRGNWRDAGI